MAHQPTSPSSDPTRATWLDKARPTAEQAIAKVWRPQHRVCLMSTSPRRVDRKGRLTSGIETKDSRIRAFDVARRQVLQALIMGDLSAARSLLERSEFAYANHLATSADEAATRFAEALVAGDNAWADGDAGEGVLWISSWRE